MLRTQRWGLAPSNPLKDSELVQQSWAVSLSLIPESCLTAWPFHFCWAYPGAEQPDVPGYSKVHFSSTQYRCAQTHWPPKLLPADLLPCSLPRTKFLTKDKEGTWEDLRLTVMLGYRPMFTLCQKPLQEVAVGCPRWLSHRQLFCFEHG